MWGVFLGALQYELSFGCSVMWRGCSLDEGGALAQPMLASKTLLQRKSLVASVAMQGKFRSASSDPCAVLCLHHLEEHARVREPRQNPSHA